jgi:serine/threonine protein kinase
MMHNYEKIGCQEYDTGAFVAPELSITPQVDIYSLGIIVYLLLSGGSKQFNFKEPCWTSCSFEIRDFISKCIDPNPQKRHTASQLEQHEFVAQKQPIMELTDFTALDYGCNLLRINLQVCIKALILRHLHLTPKVHSEDKAAEDIGWLAYNATGK